MITPSLATPAATSAICSGVAATSFWPMADWARAGSLRVKSVGEPGGHRGEVERRNVSLNPKPWAPSTILPAAQVQAHLGERGVARLGEDHEQGAAAEAAAEVGQVAGGLGEVERADGGVHGLGGRDHPGLHAGGSGDHLERGPGRVDLPVRLGQHRVAIRRRQQLVRRLAGVVVVVGEQVRVERWGCCTRASTPPGGGSRATTEPFWSPSAALAAACTSERTVSLRLPVRSLSHEQVAHRLHPLAGGGARQLVVVGPLDPRGPEEVAEVAGEVGVELALGELPLVLVAVVARHRAGQHHAVGGGHRAARPVERLVDGAPVGGRCVEVVGPPHLDVVELHEQDAEQPDQEAAEAADGAVHQREPFRALPSETRISRASST